MLVTIRVFARLKELTGAEELRRNVPGGATARGAWEALTREFPALAPYSSSVSCAVNEEYAPWTTALREGDEVAFLPPVSGGSGALRAASCGSVTESCSTNLLQ